MFSCPGKNDVVLLKPPGLGWLRGWAALAGTMSGTPGVFRSPCTALPGRHGQ